MKVVVNFEKTEVVNTNQIGTVKVLMLKGEKGDRGASGDYDTLENKPSINSVQLNGNKTAYDLGLATPSDISSAVATKADQSDLDALATYPDYSWVIGKEIRNRDGLAVDNNYSAVSDYIYATKHSVIVNNTPQRDSNSKALVTSIALYNGGRFVRRDSIQYNSSYTIVDDVTSIRISIGRYSSSGVVFTEPDIDLFNFDFYVNRPAESVVTYKPLPERKFSKFRYLWHDNFHRADASNLGTNGDTLHPMTYEYAGGQLKISNDACVNTTTAKGQAYADMGVSDCVIEFEADLSETTLTTRGAGVLFRRTDNTNFLYCQLRKENLRLGKVVNSNVTELKIITVVSQQKAPKKVSVILKGGTIRICTNGVEVYRTTESFNSTATVHGLYVDSMSDGNNPMVRNFGVKTQMDWEPMVDQMDYGELPYNIVTENAGQSYNFAIQNQVVCNSNTALRFENRRIDNYKRSEIAIKGYGAMLDEQVIAWDMLLCSDYAVIDPTSEIIMQMHDLPDDNSSVGTQPSFSLYIRDGKYFIHTQYSPYKATYDTSHIVSVNTEIGSYVEDIEQWVHWELHIKWAYNDFFEPFMYVYKNGVLVYESHLPNVINAAAAPYAKFGMYTFNWIEMPDSAVATVRTMYVDNIKPSY